MKNDFDRVAVVYDLLAHLVFGNKLDRAQQVFLNELAMHNKVLIVGGGTGKILEWLPEELAVQVDYLELSEKMLSKAKRRKSRASLTRFIQGNILEHHGAYDVIIANFFLDCFAEETLHQVLSKVSGVMIKKGKLIVTDFCPVNEKAPRFLNGLMHRFFKLTANLEADHLKDIRGIMRTSGFMETSYKEMNKGQLFTGVYTK